MKKYTLTEDHRARLKPWADKWIANAISTKPMDEEEREICRKAVIGLYAAANLHPPRIVFAPSPFVVRFAGGFSAAIWFKRKTTNARAATRAATDAATCAATDAATYAATYDATDAATRAATYAATYAATRAATYDATDDATDDATRAAINDNWWRIRGDITAVAKEFGEPKFLLECARKAYNFWQGGNQWSGWAAYLSFFRHVAKLNLDCYPKWDHWEQLTLHSGPRVVHEEFCIISDRPCILKMDDENRPHCEDGPFCQWSDGSALFAVHGVRVPWWVIERPQLITIERIQNETNAEVRRVMIQKFGTDRFLRESGAKLVHSDSYGNLYRQEIRDDEPLMMVEVLNSTPESDGALTRDEALKSFDRRAPVCHDGMMIPLEQAPIVLRFKAYFIRVPPTARTAHEAVAWTWDLTPEQYTPVVET